MRRNAWVDRCISDWMFQRICRSVTTVVHASVANNCIEPQQQKHQYRGMCRGGQMNWAERAWRSVDQIRIDRRPAHWYTLTWRGQRYRWCSIMPDINYSNSIPHLAFESTLSLWRPQLPYGYSCRASVPDRVKPSFVIFDIRAQLLATISHAQGL